MECEGSSSSNLLAVLSDEQKGLFLNILKDCIFAKMREEQARHESDTNQLVLGYFDPNWPMDKKRNMTKTFLRRVQINPDTKNYESIYVAKDGSKVAIVTFASIEEAQTVKKQLTRQCSNFLKLIDFARRPSHDIEAQKKELALMAPEKRFFASLSVKQMREMERDIKYQFQFGALRPRKLRLGPIPEQYQTDTFAARNFVIESIGFLSDDTNNGERYVSKHVYVSPSNLREAQVEFCSPEDCTRAQQELLERRIYKDAELI